jgi:hypothetical protein
VVNPNDGLVSNFEVLELLVQRGNESTTATPLYPQPNTPFSCERQVYELLHVAQEGNSRQGIQDFLAQIDVRATCRTPKIPGSRQTLKSWIPPQANTSVGRQSTPLLTPGPPPSR